MPLGNSADKWGALSKWLHWLIALLIIGTSVLIWHVNDSTYWFKSTAPIFLEYVHWHKAFGLLALVLILVRLWWRRRNPPPQVAELTPFEERWSKRVHAAFYILMVIVPISGWVSSSFFGSPTKVFGWFVVPGIVPENKDMVPFAYWAHFGLAWALMLLVVGHIGGALYHHFVRKDRVLTAMLPERG
ncbi:cytochrome b [Altererythrobacter sp. BO-6]|uniref:cytochrome b n=1 Tax=Altererythrobacter sp. BO-6 TaxID=2604537 RepID=UPI0013E161AE|nr:cytochrome b [Altererythrobacter sp. BO-6]QIG53584.1 cytochrome b [Altererythrobacter sp. BO-6]